MHVNERLAVRKETSINLKILSPRRTPGVKRGIRRASSAPAERQANAGAWPSFSLHQQVTKIWIPSRATARSILSPSKGRYDKVLRNCRKVNTSIGDMFEAFMAVDTCQFLCLYFLSRETNVGAALFKLIQREMP